MAVSAFSSVVPSTVTERAVTCGATNGSGSAGGVYTRFSSGAV